MKITCRLVAVLRKDDDLVLYLSICPNSCAIHPVSNHSYQSFLLLCCRNQMVNVFKALQMMGQKLHYCKFDSRQQDYLSRKSFELYLKQWNLEPLSQ
jgi:hypothetical protein